MGQWVSLEIVGEKRTRIDFFHLDELGCGPNRSVEKATPRVVV
jgi:hypothetical protein